MRKCTQCEQATIELALIKNEVDAWRESEAQGLGQLSAAPRMRRIAQRFNGFELIAQASPDGVHAGRLELRFPEGRNWTAIHELGEWARDAQLAGGVESAKQRSSMRTLFEFRTRSWVKWIALPIAWALSMLVAWWVIKG